MEKQPTSLKNRESWCDVVRGICALTVLLSHIPGVPDVFILYITPFTLPCFFLLSGYFTKNYGGSLPDFFYNRVLKDLLLKLLFVFCLLTLSLKTVAGLILHPSTIPEWFYNLLVTFLLKPEALFFSILTLCSVYFIAVNKICRDKPLPMIAVGTVLAFIGYYVSTPRIIRLWAWDTALVCVLFYILGYCMKKTGILSEIRFKPAYAVITGCAYFTVLTLFALVLGVDNAKMIVGNNTFLSPFIAIPQFVTGNVFIITLANVVPKSPRPFRLLMYIGRHSMLYFMIGGLVFAYVNYFNGLLYGVTRWGFMQSLFYKLPVFLIATVAITLIPAKISDRYCPLLNGRIRLPKDFVRRRPKTCIAVCAAVLLTGAGIAGACLSGLIVPNRIYARHYHIQGVDVSSYQGDIDWKQLEAQNVTFAYIKATEGSGHVDRRFAQNWRAVSDTDIIAGAYHLFSFESSGKTQAENFISTVPVSENALPPVVDLEYYGNYKKHPIPAERIVPELCDLLDALEEHYGKRSMIYVTDSSYLQYVYTYFDDYDIWFRSVFADPPEGDWRFWQYTDRAKLSGYDGEEKFIDMNVFLGSEEEWISYIQTEAPH